MAILLWSTGALAISYLKNIPQFQMIMMASGVVFFITLIKIIFYNQWHLLKASKKTWALMIIGLPIQQIFFLFAYKNAPPEEADIIIYLWPIFALIMMAVFMQKKLKARHYLSGLLGFLAIITLSFHKDCLKCFSIGHLTALGSALSCSFCSVFIKRSEKLNFTIIGFTYSFGFIFSSFFHAQTETFVLPNLQESFVLLYYILCLTALPFLLWTRAMQNGNEVLLTTTSYIRPVISIILLVAFGFATMTVHLGAACLLILLSGIFSNDKLYIFLKQTKTA